MINKTLNTTSKDINKKKIKLSNSKIVFCDTFFKQKSIHCLTQCESKEVFIGRIEQDFQIIWKGEVKQKITCLAYSEQYEILYIGTLKGTILTANLKNCEQKQREKCEVGKIDAIDQSAILAMFISNDHVQKTHSLITINTLGILRRYKANNYEISIEFPFKLQRALTSKTIQNAQDVVMVFLKEQGKFPYFFTLESILKFCDTKSSREQIAELMKKYEASMKYLPDEETPSSQIKFIAISNTKKILGISQRKRICVYSLEIQDKQHHFIKMIPEFKLEFDQIFSVDILDSQILLTLGEGIIGYDAYSRQKIGRLCSKTQAYEYNIGKWVGPTKILFGSTRFDKMKMAIYQFKKKQSQF